MNRQNVLEYSILTLIILGYLVLGAAYALKTPEWQAPDEPAHYNVVVQIANAGCCPVIELGDWDSDYLEQLKSTGFPENSDISSIEYEDHQPPLYYLLNSLVYRIFDGNLIALRMLSVVFGLGVVLAAYLGMRRLLPEHRPLALAAAAFVAFLPQNLAIMGSVNNDSLANMLAGIILVVSITYLGNPFERLSDSGAAGLDESKRPHAAALGGLVGIAIWTKLTIYFTAGIIILAILLRWRMEKRDRKWVTAQLAWAGGMAFVLGIGWWIRNIFVYGWPDFLGQAAHDMVVVGQTRTAEQIALVGFGPYLSDALQTSFSSFWGQFGWMAVPMPARFQLGLSIFSILTFVGFVIAFSIFRKELFTRKEQRAAIWLLAASILLVFIAYIYYNLTFYQVQGRYLYPALVPISIGVAIGLWGVIRGISKLIGQYHSWMVWLPVAFLSWMPVLSGYALLRFVIPFLE